MTLTLVRQRIDQLVLSPLRAVDLAVPRRLSPYDAFFFAAVGFSSPIFTAVSRRANPPREQRKTSTEKR